MVLNFFCAPSLIYLVFGLTQVCLDVYQGYYNMSLMKLIVTVIFTLLLNAICMSGMTVIAWMIIAIPFILMSVIISMLLFVFGLNPKTGRVINKINNKSINEINDDNSINKINDEMEYKVYHEIKDGVKDEMKHEVKDELKYNDRKKNVRYDNEKSELDVREYELLYGNNSLGKEELLFFFNEKIRDNDEHYITEDDENRKYKKMIDIIDIINKRDKSDKHNKTDKHDKHDKHDKRDKHDKKISIQNKKITFNINDTEINPMSFYKNNKVIYTDISGYYIVNGNNVKINKELNFEFANKNLEIGDLVEIYNNEEKMNGIVKISKIELIE